MPKNGQSAEGPGDVKQAESPGASKEMMAQPNSQNPPRRKPYTDMQSAARFPIKLPVAVKSNTGNRPGETQNISANGVLLQMDAEMPVGSLVDFTISLPADVVGADSDVQLDCKGRVVRNYEDAGRRGVGVVIDEYRFERS
jgi:PilZ domain-containing protein